MRKHNRPKFSLPLHKKGETKIMERKQWGHVKKKKKRNLNTGIVEAIFGMVLKTELALERISRRRARRKRALNLGGGGRRRLTMIYGVQI